MKNKYYFSITLILMLSLLLASCSRNAVKMSDSTALNIEIQEPSATEETPIEVEPEIIEDFTVSSENSGIGGSARDEISTKYTFLFYGVPSYFGELVEDNTIYDQWVDSFEWSKRGEKRSMWEATLLAGVEELNIPKDAFLKINSETGYIFTEEQINALYSGDIKEVNRCFANKYSLVVDGEIYSLEWLATHSASDYKKHGIEYEDLIADDYLLRINKSEFAFACVPIVMNAKVLNPDFNLSGFVPLRELEFKPSFYVIPEELRKMVTDEEYEEWANEFLVEDNYGARDFSEFNVINFIVDNKLDLNKLQGIIPDEALTSLRSKNKEALLDFYRVGDIPDTFSIKKGDEIYTVDWLSTKTIQDYEKHGITIEDLETLIRALEPDHGYRKEYSYILGCYRRMLNNAGLIDSLDHTHNQGLHS